MARTDNDTWDLASSVGATATAVAAARAVASRGDDALIDDRFAEPLVAAVGVDFFTRMARGEIDLTELEHDSAMGALRFADGMAVRTKYFDEFFLDAAHAGIRQAVILASGLDARAYRLTWPDGTVVFEIDQPQVIEFKTRILAELGAEPTADRRPVATDLRLDWPSALREAGFDSNQPTAWIAEGLLGYLPPEAQDRLLDDITALSAPTSRLAVESVPSLSASHEDEVRERMQTASARWRDLGLDLDMADLVYIGDRNEAAAYLDTHGWETAGSSADELFARYGLELLEDAARPPFGDVVYVGAVLK
jgi:methyltransferase (TIGR00027 family)